MGPIERNPILRGLERLIFERDWNRYQLYASNAEKPRKH
jgi:hypothetical protein